MSVSLLPFAALLWGVIEGNGIAVSLFLLFFPFFHFVGARQVHLLFTLLVITYPMHWVIAS